MSKTWATSGVDLHLDLRGSRVRSALETALRDAVRTGRLLPGARLPSSRSLAADLSIARNTVAAAYGQLVAEGWLEARQGSGTRVAARRLAPEAPAAPAIRRSLPARFDLRAGMPDLSVFPRSAWLAAARRTVRTAHYDALGYADPRGRAELRDALGEYLARARGVRASSDRIVVCSGFTQALTLLCLALRERGARIVATEAFGHRLHRDAIRANGLRAVSVPVDEDGARVDGLDDAQAVVLTPAHQFPLGTTLVAHRRLRAVEWARERGAFVVEDDYDGEFRYDRQPLGAMQALAPDHVVYAGTASKTLAPGLRLGWVVVPAELVDAVVAARQLTDGPSALDQLTMAEFLRSGAYDRHVRRTRLAYRGRRDRLVAALRERAREARITGIEAGLHAVVRLPPGRREDEVVEAGLGRGLLLEGLGDYASGVQDHPPSLVIGYGTPPAHAFSTAVARLCAVLSAT
jgi:GntR family transcriptional regulator / MocR family aminotransferase